MGGLNGWGRAGITERAVGLTREENGGTVGALFRARPPPGVALTLRLWCRHIVYINIAAVVQVHCVHQGRGGAAQDLLQRALGGL
jgi:hypothetical protein